MRFRKAVLIIHGYAGGTYDEERLANYLKLNTRFDVYQFTLPGHDIKLGNTRYNEWIKASEDMLQLLINNGYKKIYLIGHSMGGVIATYLAGKYKEVKKLVLGAPAFKYLKVDDGKLHIKESLKSSSRIAKTYTPSEIMARFIKSGVVSMKEFMSLVKKYYDSPTKVDCPILLVHGTNDDVVPQEASSYVYDTVLSKKKKLIHIEGSTHDLFKTGNTNIVFKEVKDFLKHNVKGGIYNE